MIPAVQPMIAVGQCAAYAQTTTVASAVDEPPKNGAMTTTESTMPTRRTVPAICRHPFASWCWITRRPDTGSGTLGAIASTA